MIEQNFDIPFIAALALREKQIQQNYRPIIAVHKWFARRPGTLFRGLMLAEFGNKPVTETFFSRMNSPKSPSPIHSWVVVPPYLKRTGSVAMLSASTSIRWLHGLFGKKSIISIW